MVIPNYRPEMIREASSRDAIWSRDSRVAASVYTVNTHTVVVRYVESHSGENCIPVPIHPLSVPAARNASRERHSERDWYCSTTSSTITCRALLIIREAPTTKAHLTRFS